MVNMKEKIFASRVAIAEFLTLLKKVKDDPSILEAEKKFLETGTWYYNPEILEPNLAIKKYTYELTDDAIIRHWPFECGGEGAYGYQVNAGFFPFAQREVRNFYLKKFGQEYLDYLVGENVATLNEEYQKALMDQERKVYQKTK